LPEFQINRQYQQSGQADAHSQTYLTVFVLSAGFVHELIGAFHGLFTGRGYLLEGILAE
jgi:hypothetical protein